jgi:hypothetical protein
VRKINGRVQKNTRGFVLSAAVSFALQLHSAYYMELRAEHIEFSVRVSTLQLYEHPKPAWTSLTEVKLKEWSRVKIDRSVTVVKTE